MYKLRKYDPYYNKEDFYKDQIVIRPKFIKTWIFDTEESAEKFLEEKHNTKIEYMKQGKKSQGQLYLFTGMSKDIHYILEELVPIIRNNFYE